MQMENIVVLSDKDKKGKERPWKDKHLRTLILAESYKRLGYKKAYTVQECGTFLEFKRYGDKTLKLNASNFCKDRLCPLCSWRRSLKIFGQTSKIMNSLLSNKDCRFIFLTLTARNVEGSLLAEELDNYFKAFKRLMERKQVKSSVKGWFRALEVTHNLDEKSENYDTYHPHFHIILMVNKSYFTDKNYYISQNLWTSLWQSSLKIDYIPIVNVKAFKAGNKKQVSKSVAETAKYTVKDNDYLIPNDEELTDDAVYILNLALKNRRLVAFGGEFKKIHKELNLSDLENDNDLVNTDNDDEIIEDLDYVIERYKWNVGYSQYTKIEGV